PSEGAGKRQFLYDVNNGLLLALMGNYEESNTWFEKAYLFGEDYRVNYLNEAVSYLTNPNFTVYAGEDHEHLILLYFKALNYLKLGNYDDALVECRRLNVRLQQLSDRYSSDDKYKRDAFINTLMGIIYDADHDYNNAFIAYRNAVEIYDTDYSRMFGLTAPEQLKKDLLRAAKLSSIDEEFESYKEKFGMTDYTLQPADGDLVFFWHNGLSPVKSEWGISFFIVRQGNQLIFTNTDLGISFPFDMSGYDEKDRSGLARMEAFRVAFPKYIERPEVYTSATIQIGDQTIPLAMLEDVNQVAFKCLNERMMLELSKALVRVALKKVEEYEVRKSDRNLASILSVVNAITEKADTRNWQTLPHSIYYARVPLQEGQNQVVFSTRDRRGQSQTHDFTYMVRKGQTLFHTFSSLESGYPAYGYY
ncbi:MAG TPA: hypothetical protein PKM91_14805, partial [Cyclobacteriaceae bacterium]|nr:hypothetical protein [Cytophagales bacterium]HNP78508.1 hypothetical protein [Cyclobacteriaceae bacterium]